MTQCRDGDPHVQDQQLPSHAYRADELERLGIALPLNVVDTVCRRGLSHFFFACLLLFLGLQLMPRALLPQPQLALAAEVLRWLLAAYLACYGARYVCYMGLRLRLRTSSVPLAVESHAVVVLSARWPFRRRLRCAVVYRECGAVQPRFFTGAVHAGVDGDFAPGRMAVVFRHERNARLYTVDDENAYQTISGRGGVFGNLAFPDLAKGTVEGRVVSRQLNDEECGPRRRAAG